MENESGFRFVIITNEVLYINTPTKAKSLLLTILPGGNEMINKEFGYIDAVPASYLFNSSGKLIEYNISLKKLNNYLNKVK